jgi:hypothetical protein
MQDKTPPQPYKRFSSAQVYACAFEAAKITQSRERIATICKDPSTDLNQKLDGELVSLAGAMISAGEKRTQQAYAAILPAYRAAVLELKRDPSLEEIHSRLPSRFHISVPRLQKYLSDVGIVAI